MFSLLFKHVRNIFFVNHPNLSFGHFFALKTVNCGLGTAFLFQIFYILRVKTNSGEKNMTEFYPNFETKSVPAFLFQLNSDSATDDTASNHVDSLQQSQESSSSALTEEATILPSVPSLTRLDSPILENVHSDSTSSQLPEVRSIGSINKLWCSGAF